MSWTPVVCIAVNAACLGMELADRHPRKGAVWFFGGGIVLGFLSFVLSFFV